LPRCRRQEKEAPLAELLLLSLISSSLCSLGLEPFYRDEHRTLAKLRRAIAAVPLRHFRIAVNQRSAKTSSTSLPSGGSRGVCVASSSSFYCVDTASPSSPIPAPLSLPVPHRHLHRLRGELAHRLDPFPLSISSRSVGTVSSRKLGSPRPPPPLFPASCRRSGDQEIVAPSFYGSRLGSASAEPRPVPCLTRQLRRSPSPSRCNARSRAIPVPNLPAGQAMLRGPVSAAGCSWAVCT
jgi:hypothetical protein